MVYTGKKIRREALGASFKGEEAIKIQQISLTNEWVDQGPRQIYFKGEVAGWPKIRESPTLSKGKQVQDSKFDSVFRRVLT